MSVPKELVAVMSAVRDGQNADPADSSRLIYRFRQPVSQSVNQCLSTALALVCVCVFADP